MTHDHRVHALQDHYHRHGQFNERVAIYAGAVVVLPTLPFIEMMDTTCMTLSVWRQGIRGSSVAVKAFSEPLVGLNRISAHYAHAQAQRP